MKIVQAPNSVLAKKTEPVKKFDTQLKKLASEMIATLERQRNPEGVGLAANQVGVSLCLFIMKLNKKVKAKVFVNPKIIKHETLQQRAGPTLRQRSGQARKKSQKSQKDKLEGCLSIQNVWGKVNRSQKILLQYQDLQAKPCEKWFFDFEAVIIQHEVDHLHGVLFTQRALEQAEQLYKEINGELEKYSI